MDQVLLAATATMATAVWPGSSAELPSASRIMQSAARAFIAAVGVNISSLRISSELDPVGQRVTQSRRLVDQLGHAIHDSHGPTPITSATLTRPSFLNRHPSPTGHAVTVRGNSTRCNCAARKCR